MKLLCISIHLLFLCAQAHRIPPIRRATSRALSPINPHWPISVTPTFFDIIGKGVLRVLQQYPRANLKEIRASYDHLNRQRNAYPVLKTGAYRPPDNIKLIKIQDNLRLLIESEEDDAPITHWGNLKVSQMSEMATSLYRLFAEVDLQSL